MTTDEGIIEILLVEDEKFHQVMARKFLDKGNVPYRLHLAPDGEAALDFLYRRGNYGSAPRPDLILLDLGLPKMDGQEVFNLVKKDPDLKQIPIIVLTGCDPDQSLPTFTEIPGNYRFTKWMEMKEFMRLIKKVQDYRTAFSPRHAA